MGYYETVESWRASEMFVGLPNDAVRALSLRYARWCRDLALVFERHGAARSRETILQMGEDMCSNEYWNELELLNAWIAARTAVIHERPLIAGWVTQTWQHVAEGRNSRITRLSTDGLTDPLFEQTNFDADFAHLYGPLLGPTPPQDVVPAPATGATTSNNATEPSNDAHHEASNADAGARGTTAGQSNNGTDGTATADTLPPLMRSLVVSGASAIIHSTVGSQ